VSKSTIVYVVNAKVPEEVRAEKICASLVHHGHNVIIACKWSGETEIREKHDGYTIIRLGKGKGIFATCFPGNTFWQAALSSIIQEFNPDLIICREMIPMQSCVKATRKTIPIILDMAEHYPAAMREWKKYRMNPISRLAVHHLYIPDFIEKHAVQHADAIITVCKEQNERLNAEYDIANNAMFIAHNTPDECSINGIRIGSSLPPIVFGHHGYFTLERNLEMLVKGFAIAAQRYPNIKLLLAGSGETFNDVFAIASSLPCSDQIEFTGSYTSHDLADLYGRTDIGILPYAEQQFRQYTLPNKVFDYMASGKPIISSGLRPMRRLLDETQAGIYGPCETPENIAALIDIMMRSDIPAMAENGMESFKKTYNWGHDFKQILASIDFTLSHSRKNL